MKTEAGKVYLRQKESNGQIYVRKVLSIDKNKISYLNIIPKKDKVVTTTLGTFQRWQHREVPEGIDYSNFDGEKCLVLDFSDKPFFHCYYSQAQYYLNQLFVTEIKNKINVFKVACAAFEKRFMRVYFDDLVEGYQFVPVED